jgi:hypothetical protein
LIYGRKPRKLPAVLSQEEVVRLVEAVRHPVYRMALLTAYAAGLRITETLALKAEHIDAARMLLHVEQGKGQKPRLVPLSEVLLGQLRAYWRKDRPRVKGSLWLFPSADPVKPIDTTTIQNACQRAREVAGIGDPGRRRAEPVTDASSGMPGVVRRSQTNGGWCGARMWPRGRPARGVRRDTTENSSLTRAQVRRFLPWSKLGSGERKGVTYAC